VLENDKRLKFSQGSEVWTKFRMALSETEAETKPATNILHTRVHQRLRGYSHADFSDDEDYGYGSTLCGFPGPFVITTRRNPSKAIGLDNEVSSGKNRRACDLEFVTRGLNSGTALNQYSVLFIRTACLKQAQRKPRSLG